MWERVNFFAEKYGFLLWVVVIALAIMGSVDPMVLSIKPGLSFSGATGAVGAMFIVVLLVERATEILINSRRGEKSKVLENDIASFESKVGLSISPELKVEAQAQLGIMQHELSIYKMHTARHAIFLAFSLSSFVCIAGIGLLNELFVLPGSSGLYQASLFRFVDILLTASLLAGGTKVFHELFKAAEAFSAGLNPNILGGKAKTDEGEKNGVKP